MPRSRRRRPRSLQRKGWNNDNDGRINSNPDANEDGQFVAFASRANLDEDPNDEDIILPGDDDLEFVDIFVEDFVNKEIVRISRDQLGGLLRTANGDSADSYGPAISADGQQVAFVTNGVGTVRDENDGNDVYLKRLDASLERPENGPLILVSANADGEAAGGVSGTIDMSADARFAVFSTTADLDGEEERGDRGDQDLENDVYLARVSRDGVSGTTLISFGEGKAPAAENVFTAISGNGRIVAYEGGSDGARDIFIWDRLQPDQEPVVLSTLVDQQPFEARHPALSHNGDFVIFTSDQPLDPVDKNFVRDVYRANRQTRDVDVVSVPAEEDDRCFDPNSQEGIRDDEDSFVVVARLASVDASGRFVAFSSQDRLLCGDYNGEADVFVKDVRSGELALASVTQEGDPAERNILGDAGGSVEPSISADSNVVAFVTHAPNLLASSELVGRDEGPANTRDEFGAFQRFAIGDSLIRADVVFDDLKVLAGTEDNDGIRGRKGRPELVDGQGGDDRLFGWKGADQVFGGEGDDHVFGNHRSDLVEGNDGTDRVHGGRGADRLKGGLGPDTLIGDKGADQLFGGPGDDHMRGDRGQDRLEGSSGNDIYIGGPDPDHFVFDRLSALDEGGVAGLGQDVIEDFRRGDKIALLNFNFQSFDDIDLNPLNGDMVIDLSVLFGNPDGTDTITVENRTNLGAGDFVFE